jgi:hypothetical protein
MEYHTQRSPQHGHKRSDPVPPQWRSIAMLDCWTLWHRPDGDSDGWNSFVLRHEDRRFRKYHYWGGWNGERIAHNSDMARLSHRHPDVYRWLESICRRNWT